MHNGNVLIVEDDKNIAKLIRYNLEKPDYACVTTITGEDALQILDKEPVELIILDIMLPGMDGLEVCRIIKQNKLLAHIPIIMLTAKGEEVDKVVGFELGADDYVVKPFSPRAIPLMLIARHLERICDHATYIAEDVIYMVRAKIIKHHPEKLKNGRRK